ncbi:hypothetical protein O181_074135, partial [Austropuccinia psidii MF-1]|nr:hypothetical protein [Austropuccinia psidii MF-1]
LNSENGTWDHKRQMMRFIYKCNHCNAQINIARRNSSNLNKHRSACKGRYQAWALQSPGAIDPHANNSDLVKFQDSFQKKLVIGLIEKNLPFGTFNDGVLRDVLCKMAPNFQWPHCKKMASIANTLYYESKARLLDELKKLPRGRVICAAIDCWTTKDCNESYLAIVIQWLDYRSFQFERRLLAFESLFGSHSGDSIADVFWDALQERLMMNQLYSITGDNASSNLRMATCLQAKFANVGVAWPKRERFNCCACHVLCLVAKDFLSNIHALTEDDYQYFDHYVAMDQESMEAQDEVDTNKEEPNKNLVASFNMVHDISRGRYRVLNEASIETQQTTINDTSHQHDEIVGLPNPLPQVEDRGIPHTHSVVRVLRDLCSHIRCSPKRRELFKRICDRTKDPKLLPLSIPTTRWNYFLYQIQRAQQLKASIILYTQAAKSNIDPLSEETWAAMEYIEPILQLSEDACMEFQTNRPTKHLVLPFYHSIRGELLRWASKTNPNWATAFQAAAEKLTKYIKYETENNDSIIACVLDPEYRQSILAQMNISTVRSQEAIESLTAEYHYHFEQLNLPKDSNDGDTSLANKDSTQIQGTRCQSILKQYAKLPIDKVQAHMFATRQHDEMVEYLGNNWPIAPNEDIISYWKRQIISGNLPILGRIALRYLSIPASSAAVERVFSQSGRIVTPTRSSLNHKTISHLTCLKEWAHQPHGPLRNL